MTDDHLARLADAHGTPLYVYDLDHLGERVSELRAALPNARLRYAVKANPNGAVLARLARDGVGAEAITVGEVAQALRAGVPASAVVVGGPGQDADLRALARSADVGHVSLDGPAQWTAWREALPPTTRFFVRLRPDLDPGTHAHLATGAEGSKFGSSADVALALAREVAAAGRLAGFHVHAGSMIVDPAVHRAILGRLDRLLDALPGTDTVNLGGGFAVPGFDLDAFARLVGEWSDRRGLTLMLEPGRWLVADAGVLLTRVLWRKEDGAVHWICDAGMAQLLRPALYGAEHPIRVVRRIGVAPTAPARTGDVDGPLCENADRLGRARTLDAAPGEVLAVERAGAYGMAMASTYASDLRPAEVVVEGGADRLVRLRESPEDLWRLEEAARAPA